MALSRRFVVGTTATTETFQDAITYNGNIFAVTSAATSKFRVYSLDNGASVNSFSCGSTPISMTFCSPASTLVNGASAVIADNAGNQINIVNLTTYQKTQLSTSSTAPGGTVSQQIAANPNTGICFQTSTTTGQIIQINASSGAVTKISPTGLSGAGTRCVIFRPDTGTWLIGTTTSKVVEVNVFGTVTQTLAIPNTPQVASTDVTVTALQYAYPNLLVSTQNGTMYAFNWVTQTLLWAIPTFEGTASITLSNTVSGNGVMVGNNGTTFNFLNEIYVEPSVPTIEKYTGLIANGVSIRSAWLDATYNRALLCWSSSTQTQLDVYDLTTGMNKIMVPTRAQDPINTDISGARVIRIATTKVGTAVVETDQTIISGGQNLPARQGHSYIELSLEGSGINEKWDVREFDA